MNKTLKFRLDNTEGYIQDQLDRMNDELCQKLIDMGIDPEIHRNNLDFWEFQNLKLFQKEILRR